MHWIFQQIRAFVDGTHSLKQPDVTKGKCPGCPREPNERIENVRAAFIRSPQKSVRHASYELEMPPAIMWRVLQKRLHMQPYILQLLQSLKPADLVTHKNFCMEMHHALVNYDDLFSRFVFSGEESYHFSGKVNWHNVWEEIDYRIDVCRVTNGTHTERL